MLQADLMRKLSASMPTAEEAERALVTTLEALGYLLPERLVHALEDALPSECSPPLALGLALSRLRNRDAPSAEPARLAPRVVERIQVTCSVLHALLPVELVHDITRELPSPYQQLFEFVPTRSAPATERRGVLAARRPGSSHSLSEGSAGSAHPLHSARPKAAQDASVASDNPHGERKLSSAPGAIQERRQTLAKTKPN